MHVKFHLLTGEDTHESTWIAKNKHAVDTAITLFAQFPHYLCYFSSSERSVLIVLVFYYKGMLENVTMQRTQQLSAFPLLPSACIEAKTLQLNAELAFSEMRLFLENHSLEFHEI